MIENVKTFGQLIRVLRTGQNISLRKFAIMMNMSACYLSGIERDAFSPPAEEKIKELAEALAWNADELLAKGDKISGDLAEIIKAQPKEIAHLLRTISGLSPQGISWLTRQAELLKLSEDATAPNRPTTTTITTRKKGDQDRDL